MQYTYFFIDNAEFENLEDLVNNLLKSDYLDTYVHDFTAIHLKRTSLERNQVFIC